MRWDVRRAGGWAALLAGLGALGVAAFVARPGQLPADAGTVPVAAVSAPPVASSEPPSPSESRSSPAGPAVVAPTAGWTPQQLVIDRIGVRATVRAVGVRQSALDIPEDPAQVGWWVGSALPGDRRGTVLLAGHVDTAADGEGALFRLERLPMGSTVDVRAGDRTFAYRVTARRSYPKQRLPKALLARTGPAELALVTCGGAFHDGAYDHNVVVYATPVA